jgi:hypothetical protein
MISNQGGKCTKRPTTPQGAMQPLPARSKTPRVSKLTNVPTLSETTTFLSGRKRVRRDSHGVHKLFDMEAKDEKLHDANATASPVDSDVPTHVIVDDARRRGAPIDEDASS